MHSHINHCCFFHNFKTASFQKLHNMKTNYVSFILAITVVSMSFNMVQAQFRDASVPSYSAGISPISASNTGNDILDLSGITYEVTVWDDINGNNSGMLWKTGGSTGSFPIGNGSGVVDPDVCFVKNNVGLVFALVAYFDSNNNEFMLQQFFWSSVQQNYVPSNPVVIWQGMLNNSINIGSNDVGDFAIVWDEPGDQINMVVGVTGGGGAPQLSNGGNVFNLLSGSQPDVAVYRNMSTNYRQVDVAYIEPTGNILVDFYNMTELISGIINPDPFYRAPAPDLAYNNPRIACPGSAAGSQNDFTVVAEDTDGNSTWLIKGFNSNACCIPPFNITIYNDGTSGNSPFNISNVPNSAPVVSYDNQYLLTWVSWNVDNSWGLISSPGATASSFPVAMAADRKAQLYPNSNYLYVPAGNNNGSVASNVSISGNKSSNAIFSYHEGIMYEVFTKTIPHQQFPSQLRNSDPFNNIHEFVNSVTANGGSVIDVTTYDMLGRTIVNETMHASYLMENLSNLLNGRPTSLYTIHLVSKSSNSSFQGKLFFCNTGR